MVIDHGIYFSSPGLSGQGIGFQAPEHQVWYMLFIVFVPYAMLPLSLGWCIIIGVLSSVAHVLATAVDIKEIMEGHPQAVSLFISSVFYGSLWYTHKPCQNIFVLVPKSQECDFGIFGLRSSSVWV